MKSDYKRELDLLNAGEAAWPNVALNGKFVCVKHRTKKRADFPSPLTAVCFKQSGADGFSVHLRDGDDRLTLFKEYNDAAGVLVDWTID